MRGRPHRFCWKLLTRCLAAGTALAGFGLTFGSGDGGLLLPTASAQNVVVPATPEAFRKRHLGEGSSVGLSPRAPSSSQAPVVVRYTVVSPEREWVAADGRRVLARLLAFSSPEAGKTGPVEVIRGGEIQFLLSNGNKPARFALSVLSKEDQLYVRKIADAAKHDAPSDEKTTTKVDGKEVQNADKTEKGEEEAASKDS